MNRSESAAIVRQVWTEENLQNFHDCRITIDSNLYSQYGKYGRGMFVSIRRINFRKKSNAQDAECIDYVRISFGQAKLQKICGTFDANTELGRQAFFNDDEGSVNIHIFIDKTRPLTLGQRSIELEMVFTAYDSKLMKFMQTEINRVTDWSKKINKNKYFFPAFTFTECSAGPEMMRCNPKDDSFCIWSHFNEDNIMNCPPPYCSDENVKCGSPPQAPRPQKPNAAGVERNFGGLSIVMIAITFIFSRYSDQ